MCSIFTFPRRETFPDDGAIAILALAYLVRNTGDVPFTFMGLEYSPGDERSFGFVGIPFAFRQNLKFSPPTGGYNLKQEMTIVYSAVTNPDTGEALNLEQFEKRLKADKCNCN